MPPRPLGSRWGALVIDSMPPATTIVAWPEVSSSAAIIAAFMPEPHILLMVVAGVDLSRPAPSAAWRAGACPWPAPRTLPKMRSSTSVGFTPACSMAALMAADPSCDAVTEPNLPCMEPMGVRLAPTMTMLSDMLLLLAVELERETAQHRLLLEERRRERPRLRGELDLVVAQEAQTRAPRTVDGEPAVVERLRGARAEGLEEQPAELGGRGPDARGHVEPERFRALCRGRIRGAIGEPQREELARFALQDGHAPARLVGIEP